MSNIPEPKFAVGQNVNGKVAGRYAIAGRRWSECVGEYIYEVCPLDNNGEKFGRHHNQVESSFA